MKLKTSPIRKISGTIKVPGDKSISHRAIMFSSLADGTSKISGFLEGEDSLATLEAFVSMGVDIQRSAIGELTIQGVGLHGLISPNKPINLGNSGTAMRLLSGIMAGQSFTSSLTGDNSLNSRPMRRIITPLSQMGANIQGTENNTAPLHITPAPLKGIDYLLPVASAQIKSAVLLAGLYAKGKTCITEPAISRDHTEQMLRGFSYPVSRDNGRICLNGSSRLSACDVQVPADISSAAFFMVAASIAKDSDITLSRVGVNHTRTGVIDILKMMGADIETEVLKDAGGEPVANIRVRSATLKGINIPENLVPLAIDEFPAIFIAAACAEGTTTLTGAKELRVKESDRIAAMEQGLVKLDVKAEATSDGIIIEGQETLSGGTVDSLGDHRIAMAFAIAACRATADIQIKDSTNINTSFPGFVEIANQVGMNLEEIR